MSEQIVRPRFVRLRDGVTVAQGALLLVAYSDRDAAERRRPAARGPRRRDQGPGGQGPGGPGGFPGRSARGLAAAGRWAQERKVVDAVRQEQGRAARASTSARRRASWLARKQRAASAVDSAGGRRGGRGLTPGNAGAGAEAGRRQDATRPSRSTTRESLRTIFLQFENADWEQELAAFNNTDVEVPATVDRRRQDLQGRRRSLPRHVVVHDGARRIEALAQPVASTSSTRTRRSAATAR